LGLYDSVDGVTELGSTADAKRTGDTRVAPRLAKKLVKLPSDEGIEVLVVMPKSKAVADAFSHRYLGLVPAGERGIY
jgi:cobyrinic acid a,c-diamide synthase